MRLFVRYAILVAVLLHLTAAARAGDLYRGPYLQIATPESIVVVWRTEGESNPGLRFGDAPGALDRTVPDDDIVVRVSADVDAPDDVPDLYKEPASDAADRDPQDRDPSTQANTYQFEARVVGLEPAKKYYYGVYDGRRRIAGGDEDHYFITSPPHGSETNLRLWVVGDSGTGGADQRKVHEAMQAFTETTRRPLDAYLHVGDMAYSDGTDREFHYRFFRPYQETLRNTVCWPTMGNHEGHTSRGISGFGPYYDAYVVPTNAEAGGVPSGTEAYYSFDIASAHFICLDSHDLDRSPTGAMAQWLRADLEKTQADWLIAFWHHPPYTKGSHDSDREGQLIEMRENIMPILEAAGVDLVLTGHSHIYERSMLFDGAYSTPTTAEGVILDDGDGNPKGDGPYRKGAGLNPHEGTVAIVAGHGGTGLSRKGTMPIMREIILEHGSSILDIDGDSLTGRMVDKHGAVRDLFQLVKRGEVTVERVENPWQPEHDLSLITTLGIDFQKDELGNPPAGWRIARGDSKVASVRASEDGARKWLSVPAGDSAVIGIYEPIRSRGFELEGYVQLAGGDEPAAGLVFGYIDDQNYWRVVFDANAGAIETVQVKNGEENVVSTKETDVPRERWLKLELETVGDRLEIQYQDGLTYFVNHGGELPDAFFGYYVEARTNAVFLEFELERN